MTGEYEQRCKPRRNRIDVEDETVSTANDERPGKGCGACSSERAHDGLAVQVGCVGFGGIGEATPGSDQLLFRNNSFLPAGGTGLRMLGGGALPHSSSWRPQG